MNRLVIFFSLFGLMLAGCISNPQSIAPAAAKSLQYADDVANVSKNAVTAANYLKFVDEAANLLKSADEAAQIASQYSDDAQRAYQAGQMDKWLKFTKLANSTAGKGINYVDEAAILTQKIPEEQLVDEMVQTIRKGKFLSSLYDLRAETTVALAANDLANNPSNKLLFKAKDKVDEITKAYLCFHLVTRLWENRTPTNEDHSQFAKDFAVSELDVMLGLKGYASTFIGLAEDYASGDTYTTALYKEKTTQFCTDFYTFP